MMKLLFVILILSLAGCGSTPYSDDYVKQVNLVAENYFDDENFNFTFSENSNVDLRGLYSKNDGVGNTNMLYHGGAGLIGLLAQVGTHAYIVDSQRSHKLAKEQEIANNKILPLISLTKEMKLVDLVGTHRSSLVSSASVADDTINIKPIFFSNDDMTELSLKSIVWLPLKKESKQRKPKFKYKNLVQVYSNKLNESQQEKLINGDQLLLSEILSSLLTTAIYITKNELFSNYSKVKGPEKTFFINKGASKKVIRGSIVDEKCGYQIVKDIHFWFIAFPTSKVAPSINDNSLIQC